MAARQRGTGREYLVVRANSPAGEWVLPKGHIEPGEDEEAAALRELREESGVRGTVAAPLGTVTLGNGVVCAFFAVRVEEEGRGEEGRELRWLPLRDVLDTAAYPELRALLLRADVAFDRGTR